MSDPKWARGYDVAKLKRVAAVFKQHDAGMVHGPFGRYSEVDAVADLDRGALDGDGETWQLAARVIDRRQTIKDFTGGAAVQLEPGTLHVTRMAWTTDAGREQICDRIRAHDGPIAVQAWQEHDGDRALVAELGLRLACVKISAASEMRGVYHTSLSTTYPAAQQVGLGRLFDVPDALVLEARLEALKLADFAQHYSGYNKGQSWSAIALRGYYDDPTRIEKPTEMNRNWKAAHPDDLTLRPRDTELRAQLPHTNRLVEMIPCRALDRVRYMRLEPGGGELTRHADITDAEAGAAPGRVVRVHVPLQTNPDVIFHGWDLDGRAHRLNMEAGGAYYLDQRKPHTAVNGGRQARIHLVVDAVADDRLCQLLAAAREGDPE